MGKTIKNILFQTFINAIAVFFTSWVLAAGIHIDNTIVGLIVALILVLLNSFLKPILVFLTIPITIFSFGTFILVINAVLVMIASEFVNGFHIKSFWWAFLFSIVMGIAKSILMLPQKIKDGNIQIHMSRGDNNKYPEDEDDDKSSENENDK